MSSFVQPADKESSVKRYSKDYDEKNSLQVPVTKLKLADRQAKIGSLSTSSTLSKNIFYPGRDCKASNKKTENNSRNISKKDAFAMKKKKFASGRETREIMEIEVFMPYVDVDKNKIIYPKSSNPTVKRYFINENGVRIFGVSKLQEDVCKNVHLNKNGLENAKRTHLNLKSKKDLQVSSREKESKSKRKINTTNPVESSSVKRKSKSINLRISNRVDLEQRTFSEVENPSVCTADGALSRSAGEWKKASHKELQNILKNTSHEKSFKNKYKNHSSVQNFSKIHELVRQESPVAAAYRYDGKSNGSNNDKHAAQISSHIPKNGELVNCSGKVRSKRTIKTSLPSTEDVKTIETETCKMLRVNKQSTGEEESSSSISKTTNGNNGNGWRRSFPIDSSNGRLSVNRWRRKIEDDELSVKSWIERSKYLQNRDKHLQKKHEKNLWRFST